MPKTYGMKRLGSWKVQGDMFVIEITDEDLINREKCIYAFTSGGEILRIGSSLKKLRYRMQGWRTMVTNALQGRVRRGGTPLWEAQAWKTYANGEVWARVGTTVTTPVGTFPAYVDEERVLIHRHKPPLNRSNR